MSTTEVETKRGMKPSLSLAIPAWNRPVFLRQNLEYMLADIQETGTQVYISDDSAGEENLEKMRQVVEEFRPKIRNLHYVCNRQSLGHDRNCLSTLSLPDTDYVWFIGDGMRIHPGGLQRVIGLLESETPDFLSVNSTSRPPISIPSGLKRDAVWVLENLAWHLTMSGTTVYARVHLQDLDTTCSHFIGTNFPQLGILLQALPTVENGLYWLNESLIGVHPNKTVSYWENMPFKPFVADWVDLIMGLSSTYPVPSKHLAIRSHSLHTNLLERERLRTLRLQQKLGLRDVIRYRRLWKMTTGVSTLRLVLLCMLSRRILTEKLVWLP